MNGTAPPTPTKPRRRWLARSMLALLVAMLVFVGVVGYRMVDRTVAVPSFARSMFVERLNAALAPLSVDIDAISVALAPGSGPPHVNLRGLRIADRDGAQLGGLDAVVATLSGPDLRRGRIRLQSISLSSAELDIRRDPDGRFSVSFGDAGGDAFDAAGALLDVFEAVEASLRPEALSQLDRIEVTDTRIAFDDQMTGDMWQFEDGRILLDRDAGLISSTVAFAMDTGEDNDPATISFGWTKPIGERAARIEARFTDLSSRLLADQVPAMAWIDIVDAPLSGSVAADIASDGSLGDLQGVLDIGEGRLSAAASGVAGFDGAKAYFTYAPENRRLTFNDVSFSTDDLRLQASGTAYVQPGEDGGISALLGQFQFARIAVDPEGVFAEPVTFSGGAVDMRVLLDPFRVDIGQVVLLDGDTRIRGKGQITVAQAGVGISADFDVPSITKERVIELWPVGAVERTRTWLSDNLIGGTLQDVTAALRLEPGERKPRIGVGFRILDMGVRYIRKMPPIVHGYGYGVITESDLSIRLERGHVISPIGQSLDVAGSTFLIPDLTIKPAPAQVLLNVTGRLKAVLALLDEPPFEFLTKGGVPLDIADGDVEAAGSIAFDLKKKILPQDVDLAIEGTIANVRSDRIVRGKLVTAKRLMARVDSAGIAIGGEGRVGQAEFNGTWRQAFGPEHKGHSHFEAQVALSDASLREFGVRLPEGYVSGSGIGTLTVDLVRGEPPAFRLRSDLNRIALAIPPVGWSKPRNARGSLDVRGAFSNPVRIDAVALKAEGFEATGNVSLGAGNRLEVVRLASVNVGGWYKGSARLVARGDGLALVIDGGSLDFRRARIGGGSGGDGIPVQVGLDRFQITDSIALTDVQATLATRGGVTGTFTARVNGGAPVEGTLAPAAGGVRVRVRAADAGAVLRAAGLFDDARGGSFDMALRPGGGRRTYEGEVAIRNTRVRNVPALAELLNAISVVGLIEQLGGEGIGFASVEGRFRIRPGAIDVIDGNAIGPSMGLTMEGTYATDSGQADMAGVITPFYVLNGIFEQTKLFGGLFGRKKGEGVVGITYRLKGPLSDPRVIVNPFSILTPGVFREIFNAPPPKAAE